MERREHNIERGMTRDVAPRGETLAFGLGCFSLALGAAEMSAPRAMARLIGVPPDEEHVSRLRQFGMREVATGLAILAQPRRSGLLWSRVGGDVLDLSYLGDAWRSDDAHRGRLFAAAAAVLGVTALDVLSARQLQRANGNGHEQDAASGLRSASGAGARSRPRSRGQSAFLQVDHTTTVNRTVDEVYRFWRDFQNFPRFMRHVESVELQGDDGTRSHWRITGPAGMSIEFDAEIVAEQENQWLAWRSREGSSVQHGGSVRFKAAPGGRGTEVRVQLQYRPLGGSVGQGVAWLFGEAPEQQVREDLHRFKQLMEAGEIPISDGPGLWKAARPAPPSTPVDKAAQERHTTTTAKVGLETGEGVF